MRKFVSFSFLSFALGKTRSPRQLSIVCEQTNSSSCFQTLINNSQTIPTRWSFCAFTVKSVQLGHSRISVFSQMNCPCTIDLPEVSSFYSFLTTWQLGFHDGDLWNFLPCGQKKMSFLCLLELMFYFFFTPDVKTPTRTHFSSKFFQYELEFNDDKDRNQSAKKKNITASKIYALISISFICCDSYILFLQSAKCKAVLQ